MSLYWPEHNIALEIEDDPASKPFDIAAYPDTTVIRVTRAQIEDPEAVEEIARQLALRMGANLPPTDAVSIARRRALHRTLFGSTSTHNQLVYTLYLL